jgi:hypothetical protein
MIIRLRYGVVLLVTKALMNSSRNVIMSRSALSFVGVPTTLERESK